MSKQSMAAGVKIICANSRTVLSPRLVRWVFRSMILLTIFTAGARRRIEKMSSVTSLVETRSSLPAQNTPRLNIVAAVSFLTPLALGLLATATVLAWNPIGVIVGFILGLLAAQSPKIARQWERAVVLRLGRYVGLRGPGLFWIIPFVDTISTWVDQR